MVDKSTTFFRESDIAQKWYVVDANGKTLGRIASQVARILRGKHKPQFTPNSDMGDFVIVVNAEKVKITGKRLEQKEYFHYTGYPGGAIFQQFKDVIKNHPERVIEHAVKGMIPHTKLGRQIIKKLKVYPGTEHPHSAQKPEVIEFN
ncbi:MAG TPA: 50S ribosomal protein L13 [Bacteroidetes bacterium]|jgi:large subunit ribosomal protein L13|nr:50S ribosomal protein L13 [Bacteroidota bacterium]